MTDTAHAPTPPAASASASAKSEIRYSEVLRKARALITPNGAWIKNASAKDAHGNKLDRGDEPGAICFCAIGAIEFVMGRHDDESFSVIDFMRKRVVPEDVYFLSHWNDNPKRTKKQVLAAFDKAVALAESEGR